MKIKFFKMVFGEVVELFGSLLLNVYVLFINLIFFNFIVNVYGSRRR